MILNLTIDITSILAIIILIIFICIGTVLYIKQYRIQAESKRIEEESERLSKLQKEEEEEDKPYEDFTSGHLY